MIESVKIPSRLKNGIDPTFIIGRALATQGVRVNFDARLNGVRAIEFSSEADYQRFQKLSEDPSVTALDHTLYGYNEFPFRSLQGEVGVIKDLSRREERRVLAYGYRQAANLESSKQVIEVAGFPPITKSDMYIKLAQRQLRPQISIKKGIQFPALPLRTEEFRNILTRVVNKISTVQSSQK